ncbi:beta-N-acetylhexosaminidase [Pelagovum pacificum]|nr:beta-N-acetylhexosaminidase [Pelagovum pacificum]
MAPAKVVRGGTLVQAVASYHEVELPDLVPGTGHEIVLQHLGGFRPANRAWLPLGAYLRAEGEIIELPALPAGVTQGDLPPGEMPDLRIVPPVTRWSPVGGQVSVTGFVSDSDDFEPVVQLAERTGLGPFLIPDGLPLIQEVDGQLATEAYRLNITESGVSLAASSESGRFYGAITLLTLLHTHEGQLPLGEIEDAPRFEWRGQHLDCARHFFEPSTIKRLMDLMALLKMNRFHWHFADDEAFRVEVESVPELWQKTAFRGEGELLPGLFGGGPRAGGTYSLDDVAEIIAHGQALNIGTLPEIEVPAHSYGMAKVLPGLRDDADTGAETSVQGYPENVLSPASDQTWEVLGQLSAEVAGLFPLGLIHLGCDELPDGAWDGSPAIDALKKREGLSSRDDVQGWTMARLAGQLAENGHSPVAWEEAARGSNGGIGHGAILQSWSGQGPGIDAARAGYDIIMSPAQHVYLDMAHSAETDDWGASWAAFIPLEETINWSPVPSGAEDIADRIIGVEGCFWAEFTTSDQQIEPMLAPRILGVASKAWDIRDSLTGESLRGLARAYLPIFDSMNWVTALR